MTRIKEIRFRGRRLGKIDYEEKVYISERTQEEHFFYKFMGYGISESVLDILKQENIEKIRFIIQDMRLIIETTIFHFWSHGIEWTDNTFGKEEKQLILPTKYWNQKQSNIKQAVLQNYGW